MTTSIRDLLEQVRELQQLAQQRPPDPELAVEARQVIGAAAASLHPLQQHWRPDWSPEEPAHQLVTALAEACAEVQAGTEALCSRVGQLAAVAGDAVATLCGQANPAADRWAIAVAIADISSHATATHRHHGPDLPDPHVEGARQAALAILRRGRPYVPGPSTGVLDLPISSPPGLLPQPLPRAAAAAAEIERILALAAIDHTRPPITIYQLRALARAFQTATQLIGAELGTPATGASQAWEHVRQLARDMRDGVEPAPDGPERLARHCAQLHASLLQRTPDRADPHTIVTLQEILARTARSAGKLAAQAHRLAGRVYAPAWEFPARETRVGELLRRQAIIIDAEDTAVLGEALRSAQTATAEMLITSGAAPWGLGDYPIISPDRPPVLIPPSIEPPGI